MLGWYYDPTYMLVIFAFVLTLIASGGIKRTFSKYNEVRNARGMTGADAARMILNRNGLSNVAIERVSGDLTDHFDPRTNVLRLSDSTYASDSVAAVGVAAHEAGHAIQHADGYTPIRVRNAIVPVVNISSNLALPLFFVGVILGNSLFANIGIVLFSAALIFQLITLPVEFNASRRAISILGESNMLYEDELKQTKKVLSAAAMTYVAGVAASLLQLLRLVLIANRHRRD
jgi:Zn-dependent membrane protease YugP